MTWGVRVFWRNDDSEGHRDFVLEATEEEVQALVAEQAALDNHIWLEDYKPETLTIAEFRAGATDVFMPLEVEEEEEEPQPEFGPPLNWSLPDQATIEAAAEVHRQFSVAGD